MVKDVWDEKLLPMSEVASMISFVLMIDSNIYLLFIAWCQVCTFFTNYSFKSNKVKGLLNAVYVYSQLMAMDMPDIK